MHTATVRLTSASPYSQSRPILVPKDPKETHEAYERRTWRERLHVNKLGNVFIPPMAFKNALSEAAQYNPIRIPGKGTATYTKNIVAGTLCIDPLDIGVKASDVDGESLFVPGTGVRGGGKRVWKTFPLIHSWAGNVTFHIFDDLVTQEIFMRVIVEAGQFVGIGRFRPRNNGFYGRFTVDDLVWR